MSAKINYSFKGDIRVKYQVLTEIFSLRCISFFAEHLLCRFLEIRTTLVIELLLRVSSSSLGLCVLQWLLTLVLILVGRWSLLHSHHSSIIGCSALATNSITHSRIIVSDSTFSWHDGVLLSGAMLNLRLLSDDIKHTVFQRFLVFTQSILLPSIVEYLGV